jgi:drug/metabolite transporter (DMT)-like permease
MNAPQLLYLRSCSSAVFFLALINRNLADFLYHKIPRKYIPLLIVRVLLGIGYLVSVYTAAKVFPLITVTLVQNMSPLITALMSYFYLKKGLTPMESSVLIISFTGVVVLITGSLEEDQQDPWINPGNQSLFLPIVCLVLYPFLSSSATILTRQLRMIHELSVSSYIAFTMVVLYGTASYF